MQAYLKDQLKQQTARSHWEIAFLRLWSMNPEGLLTGLPEPVSEYVFARGTRYRDRRWRFDFARPDLKFAFEIEGGTGNPHRSRHTNRGGFGNDIEKYNAASELGWCLMRCEGKDLRDRPLHVLTLLAERMRDLMTVPRKQEMDRVKEGGGE